jgi:glutathione S-transferase
MVLARHSLYWQFPLLSILVSFPYGIEALSSLLDVANMALQNAPSATRFVTHKKCPFAQKAWCALECLQTPYQLEEIPLYGANGKPDWFWKLNPQGTVPVLVCHGGAVVFPDSDVILDQIEKGVVKGAVSLYPDDNEGDQRRIREWRDRINAMLPVGKLCVLDQSAVALQPLLQSMDQAVVGPYLVGEQITTADCHAFPFLWRLNDEFDLTEYKRLQSWLKTCEEQTAFRKTIQSSWWWWW